MGFFSNLFKSASVEGITFDTEQEAFLAILLIVASADGIMALNEFKQIGRLLANHPLFTGQDVAELQHRVTEKGNKIGGVHKLMSVAVNKLNGKRKQSVFVYAVDLVLADGVVTHEEERVLADLQKCLGVTDSLAKATIDVVIAKNQM